MRNGFGIYGNSQTIWAMLPPVEKRRLEVGDLVVFGPDGTVHAAMVYQVDADPMLWSFGHEGAPNLYRLSADNREHVFRKLMRDPPVTAADAALRAETGFYAWVAWRLGEGDWRGRGRTNPAVRPHVPDTIPPDWWTRLERFLANRTKGNPPT
jgi:hypothetical protein